MMASSGHTNPVFEGPEISQCPKEDIMAKTSEENLARNGKNDTKQKNDSDMTYGVEDVPPWYLCALLGMQQYMTMVGATITIPFILTPLLCIEDDDPARGKIVSSILFVSGIVTILQTTFGLRLPIVQGGTFSYLLPTITILTTSFPPCETLNISNMTTTEKDELWMVRIREIQGAIILVSSLQIFIGFSGLIGALLAYITPLTIVPTITLIGLALFNAASSKASGNWYIAFMTAFLLILFSQYFADFNFPFPYRKKGRFRVTKVQIFKLFPVFLAIMISWLICAILTRANAFGPDSAARTDQRIGLVGRSPWFYVPYPLQWGIPTFSVPSFCGMLAGVVSSVIESIGDYYACARLSGVNPPPKHAVNRGIGMEGLGGLIAGLIGTGNSTTSYSENIGAIRVTKVASRRVIQAGAIVMIVCAMIGKFGALFVTLPDPVIGGVFMVMFSVITAVGLSNLQVVDLNSSRNIFVLGFSLFMGITIPEWLRVHPEAINTGNDIFDQIVTVILSTHMLVGGALGLILDNTIPGTDRERGLHLWNVLQTDDVSTGDETSCYDLPFGMSTIRRLNWCEKVPFSPTYKPSQRTKSSDTLFSKIKEKLFTRKTSTEINP